MNCSSRRKAESEIIIVGGGVIGLTCAWRLARRGARVMVLEQNRCGSGATGSAIGILWPPSPLRSSTFHHLHCNSLGLFHDYVHEIEADSGMSVGYSMCGGLEVINSKSQFDMAVRETAAIRAQKLKIPDLIPLSLISPGKLRKLEPNTTETEFGAISASTCAIVDVDLLIAALTVACERCGVEIREECAVVGLRRQQNRISGVNSATELINADTVVVAAGCGSNEIDPIIDRYAHIQPVRGQALVLECNHPLITRVIRWQRCFIRPWKSKQVAIGSTTEFGTGYDRNPTEEGLNELLGKAVAVIPELQNATVVKHWAGLRPASIDRKPYIGAVPDVVGLYVAGGHYKIGLALAPITSIAIAEMLLDGDTSIDLSGMQPRSNGAR